MSGFGYSAFKIDSKNLTYYEKLTDESLVLFSYISKNELEI